jgi:hypothetical protein
VSSWSKSLFLNEQLSLLVQHFGIQRVRSALVKIERQKNSLAHNSEDRSDKPKVLHRNGSAILERLREDSPAKYHLLDEFLVHLKNRDVLPEAQDIRYFAQVIGLKTISGKSRDDMIPRLTRFMVEQPLDKLRVDIESARGISEQQRQKGFSVLTDKLLEKT